MDKGVKRVWGVRVEDLDDSLVVGGVEERLEDEERDLLAGHHLEQEADEEVGWESNLDLPKLIGLMCESEST